MIAPRMDTRRRTVSGPGGCGGPAVAARGPRSRGRARPGDAFMVLPSPSHVERPTDSLLLRVLPRDHPRPSARVAVMYAHGRQSERAVGPSVRLRTPASGRIAGRPPVYFKRPMSDRTALPTSVAGGWCTVFS